MNLELQSKPEDHVGYSSQEGDYEDTYNSSYNDPYQSQGNTCLARVKHVHCALTLALCDTRTVTRALWRDFIFLFNYKNCGAGVLLVYLLKINY